ncbi:MAG: class I SAM-dependent methyltransferase [Acidimicrobiia bacterium]|nr:MAG: class I SAM-dependent methyltransferase [Acidimicrobiia bacterium]
MDSAEISRQIYDELVARSTVPAPRLRTWAGDIWGPADAPATLVLQHPGALRAMLLPPSDLAAGEAYVFDDFDIEGDIFSILEFGRAVSNAPSSASASIRLYRLLRQLPKETRRAEADRPRVTGLRHSIRRDKDAVSYHYDTGNEFFAQFLDPKLVYSSAAFLSPSDTLEQAQLRKLDLICRKLELAPGQRLLDVGCGWGALVVHAATEYGATAVGVTLSGEQADSATQLAKEAGVDDRVTILQRDYREVDGIFDAIASIGMFEHVGVNQLGTYFTSLKNLLTPDGVLLNHGIVTRDRRRRQLRLRKENSFVSTYVFPDGELETVGEVIGMAEDAGFELRDAESLRSSYALTLRNWVANLESNHDEAVAAANEHVYRIWRAYMAGAALGFETPGLSVYQLLLAAPQRPWVYGRSRLLAGDDGESVVSRPRHAD